MARKTSQFRMFGFPEGTKQGNASRRQLLTLNQELRNLDTPMGHHSWGSNVLQIPELDYYVLVKRFPDLQAPDAEISTRAWDKFLKSPESEPYRVRRTDRKGVIQPNRVQVIK